MASASLPALSVALLAEGVDRNVSIAAVVLDDWLVALLAEGVDRNRYVWHIVASGCLVALLAEGVDRNHSIAILSSLLEWSPSSRRAWIEIGISAPFFCGYPRRPPRGGRG